MEKLTVLSLFLVVAMYIYIGTIPDYSTMSCDKLSQLESIIFFGVNQPEDDITCYVGHFSFLFTRPFDYFSCTYFLSAYRRKYQEIERLILLHSLGNRDTSRVSDDAAFVICVMKTNVNYDHNQRDAFLPHIQACEDLRKSIEKQNNRNGRLYFIPGPDDPIPDKNLMIEMY